MPRVSTTPPSPAASALGERVRKLRVARGLTQTDLARDRFTKEYMSQIERGKARPTAETLEWLAHRLGVGVDFLETGVFSEESERAAGLVTRAEAAIRGSRYDEALDCVEGLAESVRSWSPELELRALLVESSARIQTSEIDRVLEVLTRARELSEGPGFTEIDRARVLFHLGRYRYKMSSIGTALALLTEALEIVRRSALSDDRLRSSILRWRSRCYRRQRDWVAARDDCEQALELAEALGDPRSMAHSFFQMSIIADRHGRWVLARSYAERAKALYEQHDDRRNVGRLLNNLGVLHSHTGRPDQAEGLLKDAFRIALELGSEADAAQAVCSLASVHLRAGELEQAEEQARHALRLLDDRVDWLDEIGTAYLVLGRSLLEQGRLDDADEALTRSESTFGQLSSGSHKAAAWMAQGDLAERRGDERRALNLYRKAAQTLEDVQF